MPTIATNIHKELSTIEKKEILAAAKPLGVIQIHEYKEKGVGLEEIIKFICEGFDLKRVLLDSVLWDSFKSLFEFVYRLVAKKFKKAKEVQFWIRDTSNPSAINIAFSLQQENGVHDLFILLRTKLDHDIFSKKREQESSKIFWIAYDNQTKEWLIKVL